MSEGTDKLFGVAEKIKTPLALAGLIVLVFYLLIKQVLSLNVFANIGSSNTFSLLENVLDKVFWLAIVAVILGIGSYVVAMVLKHQIAARSSNVHLLDARLDPKDSPYEEVIDGKKRRIRPKRTHDGQARDDD